MAKTGIAGNHGGKIRSDCRIQIGIGNSGGINIDLESRVDALYGRSIRELTEKMMGFFGVSHARISIQDSGALEFVLAARIEAALKKINKTSLEFLPGDHGDPESTLPVHPGSSADRFRFTRLYLPGNNPAMMLNAGIHNPDGIILDLEDSVAPAAKEEARLLVRNALGSINFYGAERMVRINQLPDGILDLEAIMPGNPDLVLIPKVESPDEVLEVEQKIRALSGDREVFLMPILESALGIERAYDIASCCKSIVAMAIGLEDYTADMGVQRTEEGMESLWARSRMVNACKAACIQAIDSVYSDVDNETGLRNTVQRSRSMGFEGMGCIHPRQVRVIREEFSPTETEIEKAKAIFLAFAEAEKKGLGVVSLGSKMIDPPVVKRAERTIHLAIQMDLVHENWREENEKS